MASKSKIGYTTPGATFEVIGGDIVARIDGRIIDSVRAAHNANDHYGFDHRDARSWLDALTAGCLDVSGYGLIIAHES